MIVLEKTVISSTEPPWTSVLWIKPVEGGVGLYVFMNGKWQLLRVMNGKGSSSPDDDEPYDLDGVGAKKLADLEDVSMEGIEDGQILKYRNGTWENEDDDSGTPGPDTVGTEQIINNSVEMEDLNDRVKDKIQKTYNEEDESLSMDYDEVSV
jgi:hypothetical protein